MGSSDGVLHLSIATGKNPFCLWRRADGAAAAITPVSRGGKLCVAPAWCAGSPEEGKMSGVSRFPLPFDKTVWSFPQDALHEIW